MRDAQTLERVQRRASKYILLHYFTSDYKTRLVNLQLLPLMFWLELQDSLFLKCMKDTSNHLNLSKYIATVILITHSGTSTIKHNYCRTSTPQHFFFNRIVLLWQSLPQINLDIIIHLWDHLILMSMTYVPFTMFVHVPNVTISLDPNIHFFVFINFCSSIFYLSSPSAAPVLGCCLSALTPATLF